MSSTSSLTPTPQLPPNQLLTNQSELGRILGRGPWGNDVDSFAQELAALLPQLFQETPATALKASAASGVTPPIQLTAPADSSSIPAIQITRGPIVFTISINPQTGQLSSDGGSAPPQPTIPTQQVFPGNLIAYNGSNSYTVTIYPNGLAGASLNVAVTQQGGDPTVPHTVDGSVWTLVTKIGSNYFMAIPVWQ